MESEKSYEIYKTLKLSIRPIIKNPNILKLVPDHLKTKMMCKDAVREFLIDTNYKKCVRSYSKNWRNFGIYFSPLWELKPV